MASPNKKSKSLANNKTPSLLAAAETISLNRVRKVVDSVADAIDSLKEVRKSIADSDEPKLAKSLDELLDAFAAVRTTGRGWPEKKLTI